MRAGLTPKYVDVPELLAITNFTPIPPPLWGPSAVSDGTVHLDPPVPEFRLTVGTAPLSDLPEEGPRVILTLEGSVRVRCSTGSESLTRGESVFLSHADGKLTIDGTGRVVVVSVPA